MSDVGEKYTDFIKALNALIGNKSLKAFISLRYSKKVLNELWKYIKNGIPIPDNVLYKHYPKDTRNHINARVNILNAQSSINTQRIDLANFVNDLYQQHDKKSIFIPNHKNTITHNGGAFLNIIDRKENYTNIKKWKEVLLHFKGGSKFGFVIGPYDEKNDSVVFCFADVGRFFRNVKAGIEVAKTLTNRGIILVFLGNHLIITKKDIPKKDMNKKTPSYVLFLKYLQDAENSSKEKSDKMLQKNEARRRQKRKSPTTVPHDEVNILHNQKCSVETHSSDVRYKKQRNNTYQCTIYIQDFHKRRDPDDICNNCGECIINHKNKNNDLFSSFSSLFNKYFNI